jgi:hypothetical protein
MLRALQVSSTQLPDLLIDGDHIVGYESGRADIEIDGTGKTVIPGLIDAHTHNVDGDLEQALTFGVTTELDMFCLPSNLSRQRRIARERDDVADIRSAGVLATAPGGHPSQIMLADPSLKERYGDAVGPFDTIASADQAEAFVKKRVAEGIDYLKIAIDSGKVSGIRLPVLEPDAVAALVRAGHVAGLKTIAHAVTGTMPLLLWMPASTASGMCGRMRIRPIRQVSNLRPESRGRTSS